MGIFDRFKQKQDKKSLQEKSARSERQKESVKAAAKKAEEEKKKSFQSVPAAGKEASAEKKDAKPKTEQNAASAPSESKPKKGNTAAADLVLVKPIITEKAGYLSAKQQYIFEVRPEANKIMIQKAIEANYGVRPIRVNIITVAGRNVRYGRTTGRTKFWKKAIVTLPKGKTIDVYEV